MCFGRRKEKHRTSAEVSLPPPPSYQPAAADMKDGQQSKPPGGSAHDWTAPPPAQPSSASGKDKAKHDWQTAVPDTSLFPPPPPFFSAHDRSYANNATEAEAEAGEEWCRQFPLVPPLTLDDAGRAALQSSNFRLMEPAGFGGRLEWLAKGHWAVTTPDGSPDRCIIAYPPLYAAALHDPTRTGSAVTVYYEVRLRAGGRARGANNTVALGFAALPYPSFRLPGWHRGSLGVHGDDGRRYVNDRWGGKDLTAEFRCGDTYGIGMTLGPGAVEHRPRVDVFFTRNGSRVAGWDLHEETDAEGDLPVTGLEGFHDLSCAVGTFDAVDFEVILDPAKCMYQVPR
ncbi:hypothetical protein HIM_03096 [Hirsutella minnesotensis 3608]|nr:hypothetical protein HIM_03096 [Hirsutella minnesotensis 3608]